MMQMAFEHLIPLCVALALCGGIQAQRPGGERGPVRAQGLPEFKLSDFYDKESGTYFVPFMAELTREPTPDSPIVLNPGTKWAFLDSGLLHNHPLLKQFRIIDKDFTGEGPEDQFGHGTLVTLIAASSLIYLGGTQSIPNVEILNVKVLGKDGSGDAADVMSGMQWAVDNGAQALIMSLAVPKSTNPEVCSLASKLIKERGVAIFAAAGNDPDIPVCPASAEGVLTSGATELKSPMKPTFVASSKVALMPMTSRPPADQEITCDAEKWRDAYLWFVGIHSDLDTRSLVKKCPETAAEVARRLLADSDSASRRNDCNKADEFATASWVLAFERQDVEQKGGALNQLGLADVCRGDWTHAAYFFKMASENYREAGNVTAEEATLKNLGVAQQQTREFAASVDTLNKALELARTPEVNDKKGEPEILENLCTSYFALGKLTEAKENCQSAATKAFWQKNNRLIGKNALQLGFIDLKENNLAGARQHFQGALVGCIMNGDSNCAATAKEQLSKIDQTPGKPQAP